MNSPPPRHNQKLTEDTTRNYPPLLPPTPPHSSEGGRERSLVGVCSGRALHDSRDWRNQTVLALTVGRVCAWRRVSHHTRGDHALSPRSSPAGHAILYWAPPRPRPRVSPPPRPADSPPPRPRPPPRPPENSGLKPSGAPPASLGPR